MKKYIVQSKLKTAVSVLSLFPLLISYTHAKNGALPHGIGSQFGLGGAGTALVIEASNADANPAALSQLDTQISAYLINLFQTQSVDSSSARIGNPIGIQTNRLKDSPGGVFGGNYRMNEKWAAGLAISGGSTNIKYTASTLNPAILSPANSTFNNQFVNILTLVNPTVSYQRTPDDSYGFSLILGRQTLKTNLATPIALTQTLGALRVDSATGVGARMGGLWKATHFLSLGASVSTPVRFTKFKKYQDVLPDAFDIPAMTRFGVAFHAGKTDYLIDIKQIYYSQIRSLSNGLGWKNQTVLMIGGQHRLTPCWVVTAGYNYSNSPVRSNNVLLNSLIVPIARHHFTAGARYHLTKQIEMTASLEFTPIRRMIDDGSGILGGAAYGTRLKNRDAAVLLGATYHFCK